MADNATLGKELHERWNDREFDTLAEHMAPDGKIMIVGTGETFEGPEGSRKFSEMWVSGFPDGRVTVDNVAADGDTVVVEYTGTGTHTETFETSMGSIPATGRSVTLKLCDVIEFDGGKVKMQRTYFDTFSMMAQLGLADAPSTTTATQ
jgi:steroid delta-isomerase-like uncharacterized protein